MSTDPRFVDLVLLEVRMQELRDHIHFLNARLADYEHSHKSLSSQIFNTAEASKNKN